MTDKQQEEINKYKEMYDIESYHMGDLRYQYACQNVKASPHRESYLDVGCGRGEMIEFATNIGFKNVTGVEVVPALLNENVIEGKAWDLPFNDNAFEVVSLFDVIEHILYEDMLPTLNELKRVASKQIILTAANTPSVVNGIELHVNKLPYEQWNEILNDVFDNKAEWLLVYSNNISETWSIVL